MGLVAYIAPGSGVGSSGEEGNSTYVLWEDTTYTVYWYGTDNNISTLFWRWRIYLYRTDNNVVSPSHYVTIDSYHPTGGNIDIDNQGYKSFTIPKFGYDGTRTTGTLHIRCTLDLILLLHLVMLI